MGLFGPPNVEKLESKHDIDGLVKALNYNKDIKVQRAAAKSLGKIGDANAVIPLIEALKNKDDHLSYLAAEALGKIGDTKAVDPLINSIMRYKSDPNVEAIRALACFTDPRAINELIRLIDVPGTCDPVYADDPRYPHLDGVAIFALGKMKETRAINPIIKKLLRGDVKSKTVRNEVIMALANIGELAIKPLIHLLEEGRDDEELDNQRIAISALNRIKPQSIESIESLAKIIREAKNKYARAGAVSVLSELNDNRTVEPLICALDDEERSIRRRAAESLGLLCDVRAVPPLILALNEKEEYIRSEVAHSLGLLRDARAVDPLISALDDESWIVRSEAAHSLGLLRDTRAINPLVSVLQDNGKKERVKIAELMLQRAIENRYPDHSYNHIDIEILKEKGKKEALNVSTNAKKEAAWALGQIGDQTVISPLISAIQQDKNSEVRQTALESLAMIKNQRVFIKLVTLFLASDTMMQKEILKVLELHKEFKDLQALDQIKEYKRTKPDSTISKDIESTLIKLECDD